MIDLMDTEAQVVEAFARLGIEVSHSSDLGAHGDLVIDPSGSAVQVEVKHYSLVTDDVADRLVSRRSTAGPVAQDRALLVVGDRITEGARKILTGRGYGYYDLRGRLALRADRVVVEAEVEPVTQRGERSRALSGKAGLEVATSLLLQPERTVRVRELARELERAASTVSEVLVALRREGLMDTDRTVDHPLLFWRLADRWTAPRTYLAQLPLPHVAAYRALRLGLDLGRDEVGWALTDSIAASVYGAPVAVHSEQMPDFYVPDGSLVRRATRLLGVGSRDSAACAIRVAPVMAACRDRVNLPTSPTEWPLAHPLFVALDLAQDSGRGREILDDWTPTEPWTRVW